MKLARRARRAQRDEETLPLINLVFLLLVFFMLVGALSPPEAFDVDAPRAQRLAAADAGSHSLVLARDGRLGLGRAAFAPEELPARAAAWQQAHPGQVLQLKADAAAEAQHVVAVLEVLHRAGVERVSLMAVKAR